VGWAVWVVVEEGVGGAGGVVGVGGKEVGVKVEVDVSVPLGVEVRLGVEVAVVAVVVAAVCEGWEMETAAIRSDSACCSLA
jgi:hypothetical protein